LVAPAQGLLQPPQCALDVSVFTQASLQGTSPPGQVETHPLGEQNIPLWHCVPHEPQVCVRERSASQPLAGLPSQLSKPGAHSFGTQTPPAPPHAAVFVFDSEQGVQSLALQP
jgi:hypothetical protein